MSQSACTTFKRLTGKPVKQFFALLEQVAHEEGHVFVLGEAVEVDEPERDKGALEFLPAPPQSLRVATAHFFRKRHSIDGVSYVVEFFFVSKVEEDANDLHDLFCHELLVSAADHDVLKEILTALVKGDLQSFV